MNLSDNLTLEMYLHSDYATKHSLKNELPSSLLSSAQAFATFLYEPILTILGPVKISSGYRSENLNTAVKGQPTSQHCKANAIDIVPVNMTVQKAYQTVLDSGIVFDQLIMEHNSAGNVWLHISLNTSLTADKQRKQAIPYLLKK